MVNLRAFAASSIEPEDGDVIREKGELPCELAQFLPHGETPCDLRKNKDMNHKGCVLRFIREKDVFKTSRTAAFYGYIDLLECAIDLGIIDVGFAAYTAAGNGRLEVLKLLLTEKRDEIMAYHGKTLIPNRACQRGHVDCLRYLLDCGVPVQSGIGYEAALSGHDDCLQLLVDRGWSSRGLDVMMAAVRGGSIACIDVARRAGYPWTVATTAVAAADGNIEVLKHLVAQGCPYDSVTFLGAAERKTTECLRYLVSIGCQMHGDAAVMAARLNNYDAVRCIASVDMALVSGIEEILRISVDPLANALADELF